MAMIVCERVNGNIIAFQLVRVRGAQLSLTVSLPQSHIEIELRQRKFRMLGRHVIHVDFR